MYLGCTSVVVPDGEHLDFEVVRESMARGGVTVAHFVPSVLSLFLDFVNAGDLPALRQASAATPTSDHLPLTLRQVALTLTRLRPNPNPNPNPYPDINPNPDPSPDPDH